MRFEFILLIILLFSAKVLHEFCSLNKGKDRLKRLEGLASQDRRVQNQANLIERSASLNQILATLLVGIITILLLWL